MWGEDGDGGRVQDLSLPPQKKSIWRESGKIEAATGTEQKREQGEGLNSMKTINSRSAESETLQPNTWRCSGGKGKSPGSESEALRVLRLHGDRRFPCWDDIWYKLYGHPTGKVPSGPQRTTTFAGAGTRTLREKPGARCVLRFSINPEKMLLQDCANFLAAAWSPSHRFWALVAVWSCESSWGWAITQPFLSKTLPQKV